ncbi:MAG: selenocysteine-specific translation elongation factor [Synergistaceae bacterium]|jgi:selenocysteine-specific elongation factor|nr:selenocysteine-specific translation elongation factor [Synergistaceae bacterium]
MEYPFILGTAGHIDHGKTALVRAMTGVDCDRLSEEKRRGITIELGFAPLTMKNGRTLSIIDVPGHEKFIRQMTAGAAGIDAAMLVIAADEGVMPQTREHLDILNILGVKFGLIALTKKDIVNDETLEIAAAEAAELTRGSCLEGTAVIPVSSVTGEGIAEIIEEIERIIEGVPTRKSFGAFFLPIDRAFGMKGFGSVVTGTSYQGSVSEGDEVDVLPSGLRAKVRSIQIHGEKTRSVSAGFRVALNLSPFPLEQLGRGGAVCAKDAFMATECVGAWLDVLPSSPEPVDHWQRVRLHIGTSDVLARVSLPRLDRHGKKTLIEPGEGALAYLLPESKITAAAGERFVIRHYSPLITIGGGRVLLPNAERASDRKERARKTEILERLARDFGPAQFLAALARDREIARSEYLFKHSQMERETFGKFSGELSANADKYGLIEFGGGNFISDVTFETLAEAILKCLRSFHSRHPEISGIDAEELFALVRKENAAGALDARAFKIIMAEIVTARKIVFSSTHQSEVRYFAPEFKPALDDEFMSLAERLRILAEEAEFKLAEISEAQAALGISEKAVKKAVGYLMENDDLRVIGEGLLFPKKTREKMYEILRSIGDGITIATLRDAIGTSRKYSLAMLEFFDSISVTKRIGDKRILIKRRANGSDNQF